MALTFHPHPVRVLRPGLLPPCLTPLPRKLELFAGCGLDAAVVQPFDAGYAATSAAAFVARDLRAFLAAEGTSMLVGVLKTRARELEEIALVVVVVQAREEMHVDRERPDRVSG